MRDANPFHRDCAFRLSSGRICRGELITRFDFNAAFLFSPPEALFPRNFTAWTGLLQNEGEMVGRQQQKHMETMPSWLFQTVLFGVLFAPDVIREGQPGCLKEKLITLMLLRTIPRSLWDPRVWALASQSVVTSGSWLRGLLVPPRSGCSIPCYNGTSSLCAVLYTSPALRETFLFLPRDSY